ncbi:glycosyltransferase family 2 protein [Kineococcus sp. NUM-3379]
MAPELPAPSATAPVPAVPVVPAGREPSGSLAAAAAAGEQPAPVATVVLPCYNEEQNVLLELRRITAALDADGMAYEILAIDDASTDGTLAVLREAEKTMPHVKVVAFRRNGGSGTVRRIGTQMARGQVVVWTDADLTYPNERIPELVRMLLEDDSYDQVVGARLSEEGSHKILRVPAKWVIRKVAETLTNERIPDLNSGLRAFRRSVALPYLRLLPAGFSCVTTITLSFLSNQHDIRYVPIEYAKRSGRSKFHFVKDAYRYILQVLRMVMYFEPLRVLMPLALFVFGVGAVKAVVDVIRYQGVYFTSNTLLLIVSSLIIGSMALLADLIVRSRDGA